MTPEPHAQDLRKRLDEAEETIRAIQQGGVDAFVLEELASFRVYTLESADRPYRVFVEQMQQGVATLHPDGTILYCNRRLPDLLKDVRVKDGVLAFRFHRGLIEVVAVMAVLGIAVQLLLVA